MTERMLGIGGVLTLLAAGLPAQVGGGFGSGVGVGRGGSYSTGYQQFQQAGTIGSISTGRGIAIARGSSSSQAVIGRPMSALEERKSVQTLGDGTEIATSDTNLFFRDSHGRTRVEETMAGRTVISIADPVARVTMTLNPELKTARKVAMPGNPDMVWQTIDDEAGITLRARIAGSVPAAAGGGRGGVGGSVATAPVAARGGAARAGRGGRGASDTTLYEDLGVQSQNGVLAAGTRTTMTIPQGQIGNNRDIHIINERWYSDELQMLVKSVNSDPRFGETTYEVSNISRDEPDPALFQIPPDYSVVEPAVGRGGRGQVMPAPVINK